MAEVHKILNRKAWKEISLVHEQTGVLVPLHSFSWLSSVLPHTFRDSTLI